MTQGASTEGRPYKWHMTQRRRLAGFPTSSLSAIAVLALVAFCALTVNAQSGRRVPKSKSAPPPEPQSVPAEVKPAEKAKPLLSFIVGIDRDSSFANIPLYFSES